MVKIEQSTSGNSNWPASQHKGWQQQFCAGKPAQAKDCDSITAKWQ